MSEVFTVVAVGCIECGVPTELIGVYATREAAENAEAAWLREGDSWARYGGDGYVAIFPGPVIA